MNQIDEFGRDPSVQIMRKVFRAMETAQARLFRELSINPYDLRIRRWREKALSLFEQAWVTANRMNMNMDEGLASALYAHGLARIMDSDGINVHTKHLQTGEEVERIFKDLSI